MAHFAELNKKNIVTRVIVIHDNELLDENGIENEDLGIQFCKSLYGNDTIWIQTSYNGNFRKNYAGAGFKYDKKRDAFIPSCKYKSWILDEETCDWTAPVPYPNDDKPYYWDEENVQWVIDQEYLNFINTTANTAT